MVSYAYVIIPRTTVKSHTKRSTQKHYKYINEEYKNCLSNPQEGEENERYKRERTNRKQET